VRSGRIVDPEIVRQFGAHPLFGYSGAIEPAVTAIQSSSLIDVGANEAPYAYKRDQGRAAPHNLMTSTTALYKAGVTRHAAPQPPPQVFKYGALPSGAHPAASVKVPYNLSNVTWTWQPATKLWVRSYADTGLATLGDGGHVTASNIIVMKVVVYPSQYVEDPTGVHENLYTLTGTGPAQIFRNGAVINGTWKRPSLSHNTEFVDATGHVIPLNSGATWVELVPTTIPVTTTP
jgi:hypothetical protein